MATVRLLDEAGVDFTYLGEKENCCATPMLVAGKWDLFAETMKKNIAAVKEAGADTVVTSCPACDMMWRQVYPEWAEKLGIEYGITPRHYSEVLAEKLASGEFTFPEKARPTASAAHARTAPRRSAWLPRLVPHRPRQRRLRAAARADQGDPGCRASSRCRTTAKRRTAAARVLTLLKNPAAAADIGGARLDEAEVAGAEQDPRRLPLLPVPAPRERRRKGKTVEVVDLAPLLRRRPGLRSARPERGRPVPLGGVRGR